MIFYSFNLILMWAFIFINIIIVFLWYFMFQNFVGIFKLGYKYLIALYNRVSGLNLLQMVLALHMKKLE